MVDPVRSRSVPLLGHTVEQRMALLGEAARSGIQTVQRQRARVGLACGARLGAVLKRNGLAKRPAWIPWSKLGRPAIGTRGLRLLAQAPGQHGMQCMMRHHVLAHALAQQAERLACPPLVGQQAGIKLDQVRLVRLDFQATHQLKFSLMDRARPKQQARQQFASTGVVRLYLQGLNQFFLGQ